MPKIEDQKEAKAIGRRIAARRKSKGWSQLALAKELDISDVQLYKYETAINIPNMIAGKRIADKLGISIGALYSPALTRKELERLIHTVAAALAAHDNKDWQKLLSIPHEHARKIIKDYIEKSTIAVGLAQGWYHE